MPREGTNAGWKVWKDPWPAPGREPDWWELLFSPLPFPGSAEWCVGRLLLSISKARATAPAVAVISAGGGRGRACHCRAMAREQHTIHSEDLL